MYTIAIFLLKKQQQKKNSIYDPNWFEVIRSER